MTTAVFFLLISFMLDYRSEILERKGYSDRSLFAWSLSFIFFMISIALAVIETGAFK